MNESDSVSTEASATYIAAERKMYSRGCCEGADYEGATEMFIKAANLFKMCQKYERAGDAFGMAIEIAEKHNPGDSSILHNIQSSIECYSLCNSEKAAEILDQFIKKLIGSGKFLQAGKSLQEEAAKFEELKDFVSAKTCYEKAYDLLKSELNCDSEERNCLVKIADVLALNEKKYVEAAKLYQEAGESCLKVKLLQFEARNFFFQSYLCFFMLDDEINLENVTTEFNQQDPNIDGSPEGDFMNEALEAHKERSEDQFIDAYGKLIKRSSILRNSPFVKQLTVEIHKLFKNYKDDNEENSKEKERFNELEEAVEIVNERNDEDLM